MSAGVNFETWRVGECHGQWWGRGNVELLQTAEREGERERGKERERQREKDREGKSERERVSRSLQGR